MTKRAILFDFWQTLFHDMKERETFAARKQLVKDFVQKHANGNAFDVDEAFEASRPWFLDAYTRELRTPVVHERLSWVFNRGNLALEPAILDSLSTEFEEMGLMLDPRLSENITDVLAGLSRDYKLAIVSDTGYTPGRVLRKHMANHGVLHYFSAFSFSDETGRAKPHELQFRNVLDQLGVQPENAIHCGDTPTHDVRGAKQLGITSVLYTGCRTEDTGSDQPDYAISDWRQLPDIVRKVFA